MALAGAATDIERVVRLEEQVEDLSKVAAEHSQLVPRFLVVETDVKAIKQEILPEIRDAVKALTQELKVTREFQIMSKAGTAMVMKIVAVLLLAGLSIVQSIVTWKTIEYLKVHQSAPISTPAAPSK